jgi:multidrug efflux system outer membrane protein
MRWARLLCVAIPVLLEGCMLGPNYERPVVEAPSMWRFEDSQARDVANTAWWEQLQDEVLNELIRTALAENKDVRIAAARVEEFYGRLGVARSQLFPQVGAEAIGSRQRASERTATGPLSNNPFNTVQVDVFASWELDIFGRLRRLNEAARADLLATEEGRRATILGLVASVATAYVNLRDLDEQVEVSRRTVRSRYETLQLFDLRYKGGVVSELEHAQARSEYEQAAATISALERSVAQQENALAVLLGRNPGPLPRGRPIGELTIPAVPSGLPSELLDRRPDVRQAEQNLIAANANIGAAKALYFPRISLTGLFGTASTSLSGLWGGVARAWSFAGSVSAPIFTAGGVSGQIRAAEAQEKQALYAYQRAIQFAFQEVEDALVGIEKTRDQLAAQARQISALRTYARLARLRYEGGYASYLEVLDAERSLFTAELQYTQTQGDTFLRSINLYKAIGGGWVVEADKLAPQPIVDVSANPSLYR